MLLITAALAEELEVARELLGLVRRVARGKVRLYEAQNARRAIFLLRCGVGPRLAADRLAMALRLLRPALILIIGYAGALDPRLRIGDLVAIRPARLLSRNSEEEFSPGSVRCEGTWDLPGTDGVAPPGMPVLPGLTAYDTIGDPLHKSFLFSRFGTAVIDMETASMARAAEAAGVPAAGIRAVTDTAEDEFLKPLSFRSRGERIRTHLVSAAAGELIGRRNEWNRRTRIAKNSLRGFLSDLIQQSGD